MNKVIYKTGKFVVEFTSSNQKDLFKEIAEFEEVFTLNHCCVCGNSEIVHRVRHIDGNDYYELFCPKCFKTFSFGQNKKAPTLFPKYTKGEKGWSKWSPSEDQEESSSQGKK